MVKLVPFRHGTDKFFVADDMCLTLAFLAALYDCYFTVRARGSLVSRGYPYPASGNNVEDGISDQPLLHARVSSVAAHGMPQYSGISACIVFQSAALIPQCTHRSTV